MSKLKWWREALLPNSLQVYRGLKAWGAQLWLPCQEQGAGFRALTLGSSSPSSIFPLSSFPYLTWGYLNKHLSKSLDFSAGQCRAQLLKYSLFQVSLTHYPHFQRRKVRLKRSSIHEGALREAQVLTSLSLRGVWGHGQPSHGASPPSFHLRLAYNYSVPPLFYIVA